MNEIKYETLYDLFGDVLTDDFRLEAAADYALAQAEGRTIRKKKEITSKTKSLLLAGNVITSK